CGLARALGCGGLRAAARVDRGTDHTALVAPVQRGRNGGRAPLPRPFLSDGPGLSPGMARGPLVRVPPSPADASGDTTVSLHSHLVAALPLGPSLSVHALRWAATETSDRAHRRPVLWRCLGGNCHGCLPTLGHL